MLIPNIPFALGLEVKYSTFFVSKFQDHHQYHQCVLPKGRSFIANAGTKIAVLSKGRSFIANAGTKIAVLSKGRSFTANSGTKVAVLLGIIRCSSFPLLSAPHSLWTNLKRCEKIPGAPTRRWGEWIWLTGPSGLHRNSPQGLNISSITIFDQIRDLEIPITLRPPNLNRDTN